MYFGDVKFYEKFCKRKSKASNFWNRASMYSGWWFFIFGVSLMWHNVFLLVTPVINWLILKIVLINTEEKWLFNLYGDEYAEYKKHVNRLIPFKRRKILKKNDMQESRLSI